MFKFELGQVVWYMQDNKVHSAVVQSRICVENLHDDLAPTDDAQKQFYQPWGASAITYQTVHGEYFEDQLFESKEALTSSM
jgi:hypothetical protein